MTDKQLNMFPEPRRTPSRSENRGPAFTLTRTLPGSAQKVFDQWLIPVFLEKWLLGPHVGDDEILELSNSVRRGGEFEFVTRRQGAKTKVVGSYKELRIPQRLAFSWQQGGNEAEELQVNAEFSDQGDKTRIKLTLSLPPDQADRKDEIKAQWVARCDALATRLKSQERSKEANSD